MDRRTFSLALAGSLAAAAAVSSIVPAAAAEETVKCYGVALAGQNEDMGTRITADTNFVTAWVVMAFLTYEIFVYALGVDIGTLFHAWAPVLPLAAILIGFIPGCGPQIVVTGGGIDWHHVAPQRFALDRVGDAHRSGLGHCRMGHERGLDLCGPQPLARDLDGVVAAASQEPLAGVVEHVEDPALDPVDLLIVDEAQNLTPHEVKTILTRAGEGTKVVFTGDPYQIDNPYVDASNNGLVHLVRRFAGQSLAGTVTLARGERSVLAELAANIL